MVTCKCGVKLEESSGICPNCGEEIEISTTVKEEFRPNTGGKLFITPLHTGDDVTPGDRRRNLRRSRDRQRRRVSGG